MDMEEVFPNKVVKHGPSWNPKAALGLEKVDILWRDLGHWAQSEEGVV